VISSNPSDEDTSEAVPDVAVPDPAPRPTRRSFTATYKARIVAEYEGAPHGEKSAVLRREGLYRLFAVRGERSHWVGVHAALFAALRRRIRAL